MRMILLRLMENFIEKLENCFFFWGGNGNSNFVNVAKGSKVQSFFDVGLSQKLAAFRMFVHAC